MEINCRSFSSILQGKLLKNWLIQLKLNCLPTLSMPVDMTCKVFFVVLHSEISEYRVDDSEL